MKTFFSLLGIDRAVAYTLAGRAWGSLSGLVTLWFIVQYLSLREQGFYYTFASILALQLVFELGMSYVVMQFASHEMVDLKWSAARVLAGSDLAKGRLRSLLILVVKWYGAVAVIILLAVWPAGWLFFSRNAAANAVAWQLPWAWLILTAALNILATPILAILEGCGLVAEVARLRMAQGLFGSAAAWLALVTGGKLLAMPIMNTMMLAVVLGWLWRQQRGFFIDLLHHPTTHQGISWKREIWPFQWKIGLSWLSGFFIFQLFVPVLFSYRGAAEAGRMGMSLTIVAAVSSVAMAWINTKGPLLGQLVAARRFVELDSLFRRIFLQSLCVMLAGSVCVVLAKCVLVYAGHPFNERILPMQPFLLLVVTAIVNFVVFAEAAFLRSHKEEPFLWMSLVLAGLLSLSAALLGPAFGAVGLMWGYFVVSTGIGLGWGSWIFYSKKRAWHAERAMATITSKSTL